jgi:hypothetical protein
VHLSGPLDLAALRRRLRQVVAQHDVLRTSFALIGGQPIQVIQ